MEVVQEVEGRKKNLKNLRKQQCTMYEEKRSFNARFPFGRKLLKLLKLQGWERFGISPAMLLPFAAGTQQRLLFPLSCCGGEILEHFRLDLRCLWCVYAYVLSSLDELLQGRRSPGNEDARKQMTSSYGLCLLLHVLLVPVREMDLKKS